MYHTIVTLYVTVVVALDLASPRKSIPSSETFSRTTNLHTVGQRKCIDAHTELKKIEKNELTLSGL